jgi:hypothetical protein
MHKLLACVRNRQFWFFVLRDGRTSEFTLTLIVSLDTLIPGDGRSPGTAISRGQPHHKRMNQSDLAFASFVTNTHKFKPTCARLFGSFGGESAGMGTTNPYQSPVAELSRGESTNAKERWVPRLAVLLMTIAGLMSASVIIFVGPVGGIGWFGKLLCGLFFFVLGFMSAYMSLELLFRTISLMRYLSIYGFSTRGLQPSFRDNAKGDLSV